MVKILSAATLASLLLFAFIPGLDLAVSSYFYTQGQGFIYREILPSQIIYYSVRVLTLSVAMLCLFVICYDSLRPFFPAFAKKILDKIRSYIKFSRRQMVFLLLIIVITPGILVHWVMKPVWERARPVNITQFGGEKIFTDFYHTRAGQEGNSFPSGHASMSFSLVAFAYIVSASRKRKIFAAAFAYGVLASACRIWQGGHFLSDVLFSALLTLWTIELVRQYYLDRPVKTL